MELSAKNVVYFILSLYSNILINLFGNSLRAISHRYEEIF